MKFRFDPDRPDIVEVNGYKIAINVFRMLTEEETPTNWFRIYHREAGVINCESYRPIFSDSHQ